MATTTATQQIDYTYEDYLEEWDNHPENPAPQLSGSEFAATLNSYMDYTQRIGAAYKGNQKHLAETLRDQRRPLKLALLIGG